ncbi:SMC-Scp complex subunit ScpB [Acetitomaculum ruminis]|uniref:SMC-Scp complex subunit ScpB n=1 Tax=Acetitomaculum ruminis TaxID=2382 RepID=UPI001FA8F540|nr:SMC-Scp complex subunit ScpB [Acetitomaculum ruminis]
MNNDVIFCAVEAVLFAVGGSVSKEKLSYALDLSVREVEHIMEEVIFRYNVENRGIHVIKVGNGYQLCAKQEMNEYLLRVVKQPKKPNLSNALLETLSIIAYKQPCTRTQVEKIRGVSSDSAINKLIEYNLIEERGRLETPGRPILFGTTEEFLRSFGISCVEELPEFEEDLIKEFKKQAEEEIEESIDI